jgi:tRNA A37 methylthiotransferase MiaB
VSKKVFIKTFGCQMNEYDSAKMLDVLGASEGAVRTDTPEDATSSLVLSTLQFFGLTNHSSRGCLGIKKRGSKKRSVPAFARNSLLYSEGYPLGSYTQMPDVLR